jgi:TPR repeat protein
VWELESGGGEITAMRSSHVQCRSFFALALAAALLAACSGDDNGFESSSPTPVDGQQRHRNSANADRAEAAARRVQGSSDPYERVLQVKATSGCPTAIPMLEPFANRGRGYEVAQYQLGECYLQTAAAGPADGADQARLKAAEWIFRAANAELPIAQQEAARLSLDGTGAAADPIEAGKWFLLLQRNPRRSFFGPVKIDPDLDARLRKTLNDAEWQQARARADQFRSPAAPAR